jgi:anthranilate phosphoribosyltransferase
MSVRGHPTHSSSASHTTLPSITAAWTDAVLRGEVPVPDTVARQVTTIVQIARIAR